MINSKKRGYILLEIVLIISSVFVFRSLWTLMDKVDFLNQTYVHISFFVIGICLTIYALNKITHK